MQQLLEQPVEYGDVLLAPTTELAGLAELSSATNDRQRIDALVRIAATIRDEDLTRERIALARAAAEQGRAQLPQRR